MASDVGLTASHRDGVRFMGPLQFVFLGLAIALGLIVLGVLLSIVIA